MKKIIICLLALCASVSLCDSLYAQQQLLQIAVFPFEDLDNVLTRNEATFFYREFSNEFTNRRVGGFTVVPRKDVEKLINTEAEFQLSYLSERAKTAEYESVLNGKLILSGLIGRVGNRIRITVSLYTFPNLGQLPGGATISVADKNELFDKVPELVQLMQTAIGVSPPPPPPTGGTNTQTGTNIPANFVRVEGGTFQMGSSNGEADERPIHTVTVKSFYMGKYEVTQKEWREIMGTSPSYFKGDNLPVEQVSWLEAVEYCNKLSIKEGLTPAYRGSGNNITCDFTANGYRLPTEAEWEFAAKGGTKEYLTTEYSGSNSVGAVAWYTDNSGGSTHPVGTKSPNSLGLYDMSGNVWEWCWDWYANSYPSGAQTDPRGSCLRR